MARDVVAIRNLDRRLPQAGRIRIGEKAPGKGNPRALTTFRFTSPDEIAIKEIADRYGGEARPWTGAPNPGEWEVVTEADVIPVALPPDPLGGTPLYELWSGGGCVRRCDGETAQVTQSGPDGGELVDVPCVCSQQQNLLCKPTTRLTVVLPEIRFGGGWRLESHGWNVAHEMPGMVEFVEQLQAKGIVRAELALEPRVTKHAGKTKRFVVPVIRPGITLDALAEGGGAMGALGPGPESLDQGALPSAVSQMAERLDPDDEIVEAEIVEDEPDESKRRAMHARMRSIGWGDDERHAIVMAATRGRTQSSNDLSAEEMDRVLDAVRAIEQGAAELVGIDDDGRAQIRRT